MTNEEYVWVLISKKLSGEAAAEELQELDELLKSNSDMQQRVQLLESLWKSSADKNSLHRKDAFLKHLQRLLEKVD